MKKRVLIAENDSYQKEVLEKTLQKLDLEIFSAVDGREALSLLQAHPDVGLIISEIILPGLNGIELRKAQLNNPVVKDIPIIFVTSHLSNAEPVKALSPHLVLTKPVSPEDLLKIVGNLIL